MPGRDDVEITRIAAEAQRAAVLAAAAFQAYDENTCGVCSLVYGEDAAKDSLWVSCELCSRWFHGECEGLEEAGAEDAGGRHLLNFNSFGKYEILI